VINEILSIKQTVDWVVLNYHGGEEYTQFPSPKRRRKLIKWLKYVDIIVCHHSHSFQGIETFPKNKAIFYSLGNCMFDLPAHRQYFWLKRSAILTINFSKDCWDYNLTPIYIDVAQGIVKKGSHHFDQFVDILSCFSYLAWIKSCYKVLFKKKKIDHVLSKEVGRRIRFVVFSFFPKLFRLIFLRRDFRPIILGAYLYKILVRVRLK